VTAGAPADRALVTLDASRAWTAGNAAHSLNGAVAVQCCTSLAGSSEEEEGMRRRRAGRALLFVRYCSAGMFKTALKMRGRQPRVLRATLPRTLAASSHLLTMEELRGGPGGTAPGIALRRHRAGTTASCLMC